MLKELLQNAIALYISGESVKIRYPSGVKQVYLPTRELIFLELYASQLIDDRLGYTASNETKYDGFHGSLVYMEHMTMVYILSFELPEEKE
jgi:hypothetical protein